MEINFSIFGLELSTRFENRIKKFINNQFEFYQIDNVEKISFMDAGVIKTSAYGHYHKCVSLFIDGEGYLLRQLSTDSELYDYFNNVEDFNRTYSNKLKNLILEVLENSFDEYVIEKL